jgi:hypothetical protein
MKTIIPVIVGTAAILAAIATAIANANNRFVGRAYLVPWFYAGCLVFLMFAVAVNYASRREGKLKPLVVPLGYGPYNPTETSVIKSNIGHHGLVVANHGEPAYDVSVSTDRISIGTSTLKFRGDKPVLTKADGDAFFIGTIELAPHSSMFGSGLFDEMRKSKVAEITFKLIYKDAENHWYETIGKIERDVSAVGGLTVRYLRQERAKQPEVTEGRASHGISD